LILSSFSFSQERNIQDILDYTLRCRGLTRQDITIPVEFFSAAEKSPTNDSKLILPLVKDMMVNPLRSMTWLDSVSEFDKMYKEKLAANLFEMIGDKRSNSEEIEYEMIFKDLNHLTNELEENLIKNRITRNELLLKLSNNDKKFLEKNLLSIIDEGNEDYPDETNIFHYNNRRDSSIITTKKVMDLLSSLFDPEIKKDGRKNMRNSSYSDLYYIMQINEWVRSFIKRSEEHFEINNSSVSGDFYYYSDKNGIRIAIGGPGKNIYNGKFDFIIDLGGDDVYNIDKHTPTRQGEPPLSRGELSMGGFSCIIDLAGNDYYTTSSDFALAGGLFSSSFIFDKEGDDYYESKGAGNLGAAIGGLGLLYDEKGNDTYKGISFSIGAGCFGVGLLVDREGNDFYIANSYSQGFGMTEGVGAIVDNKGNDSYLVDSRSLDIGRYNDHYVSMCQGYGLGLRPYYAGGIGLIIEGEGNDIYNTDIFGQGGAYWYSLGAIVDKGGHDKYNGYQYSQGAGIHLAVGLLKDYDGWDFYQSNGVSQGCGHDFGYGMLWDVKGNDNYSAYSLSQGAGNADGIGILIDESGVDGYLNKFPSNTRGYGNPRREFGSLGIFLDASGEDYYSQPGYDSLIVNSSQWGIYNDYYLTDLPEEVSGDNFKVALDTFKKTVIKNPVEDILLVKGYTTEEYFIMAKTIEPRFSLWQDYGFRKLIEDSLYTAQRVLTKLGTDDHRETQVMRVLSQRIQNPIANALMGRLRDYLAGRTKMTQPEVSFACYIFGETKNPHGIGILLQLTYDENYRVRSSAINALGKIKYDTTEADFINRVVTRLGELASEESEKKLYNKDIAFALGNYITPNSFEILLGMLKNPYYGARFVAAENLKKFPQLTMMTMTDNALPNFPKDEIPLTAFVQCLNALPDNDFMIFVSFLKMMPEYESEFVKINMIGQIIQKKNVSVNPDFVKWCESEIELLKGFVGQKVR
jgi:hypothetical protein